MSADYIARDNRLLVLWSVRQRCQHKFYRVCAHLGLGRNGKGWFQLCGCVHAGRSGIQQQLVVR
ncbi:MAG: hypothetical protein F6K37_12225 [Moorea sp. SIO4E2]|uniref:hypothetical protein n=1 Tax=Moorena sp. SIO4E2 TaxID=2607826 RepID=UPI0013BE8829|nr:hypothetical protein [Moorena sp. SIO4E2]NEQ06670.1 hypothetical protein [Moorena sp. SIO4E2]